MNLIDKDVLVAEIEKRYKYWREKEFKSHSIESEIRMSECQHLMLLLNTLEVKEVDWKKERISECPYRQVVCKMYEGMILECKGACSWVVDYPKLKELKTQKGK